MPEGKEMVMTWGWCKWQPGFTTLYGFIWIYMDLYEGKWNKSIKVAAEWMIIYLVGGFNPPL